jgi:O-antigen/teichoic acid export membrane protein
MSDKKRFMLTYMVNALEFFTAFLAMFFVTPKITGSVSTEVYGTFAAVLSFSMFLSYADFGFLSAAFKFGCDEYLKGDRHKEVQILSSAAFVQFSAYLIFALIMLIFAKYPQAMINGLNQETAAISSKMFCLLALFCFTSIPRRIITFIAEFRIKAYHVASRFILVNLVNIALVFFIFNSNNSMNIVYYYLFSSLASLGGTIIIGYYLFRKWNYSIKEFVAEFRFNRTILLFLWPLAKASFFTTLMYLLYYELDKIYILKFFSAGMLAFYAIGAGLSSYIRTLSSNLNSPYLPKYNKFHVQADDAGMKQFYLSNLAVVAPFIFVPVIVAVILMPKFIIAWVGVKFARSILLAQFLVGAWLFAPFTDIPSYIITAKVRIREMYLFSIIVTTAFWLIVLSTGRYIGVNSLAIARFSASILACAFYIFVGHSLIKLGFLEFAKKILLPTILTVILIIVLCQPFLGMVVTKNKITLLKIVGIGGGITVISLLFYILISKQFKDAIGRKYFSYQWLKERLRPRYASVTVEAIADLPISD